MKVTVCFGRTRVLVPCGDGDLTVHALIGQAITRYRRAIGKDATYWVHVRHLEHGDGGILDWDDTVSAVADDRDKLLAVFEEQEPPRGGDGASGSSAGTQSPEAFSSETLPSGGGAGMACRVSELGGSSFRGSELAGVSRRDSNSYGSRAPEPGTVAPAACRVAERGPSDGEAERAGVTGFCPYQLGNEIEVTPSSLRTNTPLHVRRSSDPAQLGPSSGVCMGALSHLLPRHGSSRDGCGGPPRGRGRWGAKADTLPRPHHGSPQQGTLPSAATIPRAKAEVSRRMGGGDGCGPMARHAGGGAFQRVAARSSLSAAHPMVDRWLERQDQDDGECEERSDDRMDPVGHADYSQKHTHNTGTCSDMVQLVEIPNDGGPLGIHLVPFLSSSSRSLGLCVRHLEEESRAWRDSLLSTNDAIIAINSRQLLDIGFELAQQMFRHAMQCSVIRLWVVPAAQREAYERDLSSPASPASPASPSSRATFLRPRPFPWGEVSPCGAAGDIRVLGWEAHGSWDAHGATWESHGEWDAHADWGPPPPPPISAATAVACTGLNGGGGGAVCGSWRRPDDGATTSAVGACAQCVVSTALGPNGLLQDCLLYRPHVPAVAAAAAAALTDAAQDARWAWCGGGGGGSGPGPQPGPPAHTLPLCQQVHRAPCSQSLPTFPCTVAAIAAPLGNVQAERTSSPVVPRRHSGRRFRVQLQKGPEGLGFSLTSRDTPVSGPGHVYIKHILPRGAAIADGRLHAGDRLIMVNGVDVSSMSQDQVVSVLRGVHPGSSVDLLVSRHDALLPPPLQQAERSGGMIVTASGPCECLNLEIALSECGPAGLGVSVKGNRSRDGAHDLGIYVKSIIAGGAAAKDGRLRIGDQLVAVNREPLLGRSNAAAMETLRRCMATDGSERGRIHLAVARRASDGDEQPVLCVSPVEPERAVDAGVDSGVEAAAVEVGGSSCGNGGVVGGGVDACSVASSPPPRASLLEQLIASNLRNQSYTMATRLHPFPSPALSGVIATTTTAPSAACTPAEPGAAAGTNCATVRSVLDGPSWPRPSVGREASVLLPPLLASMPEPSAQVTSRDELLCGDFSRAERAAGWRRAELKDDEEDPSEESSPQSVAFEREGFGRQSMSERRSKRFTDASRLQALKSRKSKSMDLALPLMGGPSEEAPLHTAGRDVGPTLGLKKSTSLESLQTAVATATLIGDGDATGGRAEAGEDQQSAHRPRQRLIRGRACNESFRVAIDKSYGDGAEEEQGSPEQGTDIDEEAEASGRDSTSGGSDNPQGTAPELDVPVAGAAAATVRAPAARAPAARSPSPQDAGASPAARCPPPGPAAGSTARDKKKNKEGDKGDKSGKKGDKKGGGGDRRDGDESGKGRHKKSGVLKGLGVMFRFGRPKKEDKSTKTDGKNTARRPEESGQDRVMSPAETLDGGARLEPDRALKADGGSNTPEWEQEARGMPYPTARWEPAPGSAGSGVPRAVRPEDGSSTLRTTAATSLSSTLPSQTAAVRLREPKPNGERTFHQDRISQLFQEFQLRRREARAGGGGGVGASSRDGIEERRKTYNFEQPWEFPTSDQQNGHALPSGEPQPPPPIQPKVQRPYNSLPRHPKKTSQPASWLVQAPSGNLAAAGASSGGSSSGGSGSSGCSATGPRAPSVTQHNRSSSGRPRPASTQPRTLPYGYNARVLQEAQELLRQEEQRRLSGQKQQQLQGNGACEVHSNDNLATTTAAPASQSEDPDQRGHMAEEQQQQRTSGGALGAARLGHNGYRSAVRKEGSSSAASSAAAKDVGLLSPPAAI
ncbi:partitioning defective 3 homolog isoform X3 [Lethenteron reissneri]|uniref:partitioning defective 3 homolog isoform X3 n=1 Tax=Lethenteron reissneri TaxID=7753 RepID=UPI002AB62A75|nr:partitioning defective 3 homolog isoform X3 [Lethenteron reissneri]